jgi:energy-coupling factor transporter ATP-binding protein EcfA2
VISLVDRMLAGDRLALARLITRVENRMPGVAEIMRAVQPHLGRAHVLGVTGPPGAGKSTLVDRLTARLRAEGARVGVVAVDPSSPFTGGAVLGDRIRMQAHTLDENVFIRSMATRGSLGGLAAATGDIIKLMDAAELGAVSPDGSRIVFVRGDYGHEEIWQMQSDGQQAHRILGQPGENCESAVWSPTGIALPSSGLLTARAGKRLMCLWASTISAAARPPICSQTASSDPLLPGLPMDA